MNDHTESYRVIASRKGRRAPALVRAAVLVWVGAVPLPVRAQQSTTAVPSLVFDRVAVVDVEDGTLIPDQRVVITGNRITAMGATAMVKLPREAKVIHAKGRYLMPGLWDMHIHGGRDIDQVYPLLLANGVTGIRDAGSPVPLDTLRLWRREILTGSRVGPPRQLLAGPSIKPPWGRRACDNTKRRPSAFAICAADSADVRRIVDSLKAAGADMLKPRSLPRHLQLLAAAEARRLGVLFGGHADALSGIGTNLPSATEFSDSGASVIDHLNTSGGIDTLCLPVPFRLRNKLVESRASVDRCRSIAERFQRNDTWLAPTLIVMTWIKSITQRPGPDSDGVAVLERVAEVSTQFWSDGRMPEGNWLRGLVRTEAPDSLRFFSFVHQAGLPLLASTDLMAVEQRDSTFLLPGFSLHGEIAMYGAEGLTPLEALQTATLNPAKMLHGTDSLGTVAPGKLADLVLLDGNPLANITNTTTIRAVVANGRYFDRAALDDLLTTARLPSQKQP